ncbi:MAG: 50S ribosomal protein L6 [Candidatus Aenigmarchaeota archaeon]|nr:50S ribosomal protein L6 [Candidatus Aenigmarchaeota archaeon]
MLKTGYEFPEGVTATLEDTEIVVKGPRGELKEKMSHPKIDLKVDKNVMIVTSEDENKRTKAVMWTWKALAKSMTIGVTEGWQCDLKLVYSHFPVKLKQEGSKLIIENFLGEREKKEVTIPSEVKLEINGNDLKVTGNDKEKVGQAAALIEQRVTVKKFDRRVFQDGIYKIGKTHTLET